MPLSKLQRIEGQKLYKRLTGQGYESLPMYKGGLLEVKSEPGYFRHFDVKNAIQVIEGLSEKDINNAYTLHLIVKEGIKTDSTWLSSLWFANEKLKSETKQEAFELMCNSFPNVSEAKKAKDFYELFFRTCDNPWTQKKSIKPGFMVIPYFHATDEEFPLIVPPHNRDQVAYRKELQNILKNRKLVKPVKSR